jgi:hypothetical protein
MPNQRMSRLRPPKGQHKGLKIRRPNTEIRKGMKLSSCTFIDLYTGLSGRVMPLRKIEENQYGEFKTQGDDKAGERKVVITPNCPLDKIMSGDVLVIPWGVRPNTWTPPTAPQGAGQALWINTPNGEKLLKWQNGEYVSDTLTLSKATGSWCLSGEVSYCFTSDNFICQNFPTGYNYLRATGPNASFKILKVNPHEDPYGGICFYTLQVEHIDQDNLYLQE